MSVDGSWGEVLRRSGARPNPNDNTDYALQTKVSNVRLSSFDELKTVTLVAKALELNKAINLVSSNTRELW